MALGLEESSADTARLAIDYRIETGLILELSKSRTEGFSAFVILHALY